MIDIHYHLLYGVNNGPKNLDASLALAEASIAEGVTHIVATPHASYRYEFDSGINAAKLAELNQHLGGNRDARPGMRLHLSHDNISDAYKHPAKYTINGSRYLLVEFPDFAILPGMAEVLYEFTVHGIVPIITHPETESGPHRQAGDHEAVAPQRLPCADYGSVARRQIWRTGTVGMPSPAQEKLGAHGCQRCARRRSTASDDETGLQSPQESVWRGDRGALMHPNPRAIFDGQVLPEQPESLDLDDYSQPRRRGILGALFSR